MNEKPETNRIESVETPERKWTEDITIPVPLSEFLSMKRKIQKLKTKCKEAENEATEERRKKWQKDTELAEKKKAYDALKADYQKLLGIAEEKGKQE